MLVDLTFPGGYQGQFASNDYYVMTFSPAITIWPFNRYFLLTDPATASIPIYGYRSLKNQELIEGKTFPYGDPGKGIVSVLRSRWKIFGGSSEAVLKDPLATQSELLFPAKGFVEVAHDVALSYGAAQE